MKHTHYRTNRELVVIADLYLGSDFCLKQELLDYFRVINPKKIVFTGNIIREEYWEAMVSDTIYLRIFSIINTWINNGSQIYFITKTDPEILATLIQIEKSKFSCKSKLDFIIDHKKFMVTNYEQILKGKYFINNIKNGQNLYEKFRSKISGFINKFLRIAKSRRQLNKISPMKINFLQNYFKKIESYCANFALDNELDGLILGLAQEPKIETYQINTSRIMILNTGSWNASLTALEFNNGCWELHNHEEHFFAFSFPRLVVN
jgi:UDP-2,3-diacylglucosamine pyrophosphatase LpxH